MQKYIQSFEIGIHFGLLTSEWDQLKDCPLAFNVLQKNFIQTKINSLDVLVANTNFQSKKSLKKLKKEITNVDNYIIQERKKCRVLKDLSHIPNLTSQ